MGAKANVPEIQQGVKHFDSRVKIDNDSKKLTQRINEARENKLAAIKIKMYQEEFHLLKEFVKKPIGEYSPEVVKRAADIIMKLRDIVAHGEEIIDENQIELNALENEREVY